MPTTNTNNGNNTTKTDWKKNELGALWKRESKGGEKYLTGTLKFTEAIKAGDEVQVIIFSNKGKKADTHPDLNVYKSEKPGVKTFKPVIVAKTVVKSVEPEEEATEPAQELL